MDATIDTEGLDFDDFVRLLCEDNMGGDAAGAPGTGAGGFELYDARLMADLSMHDRGREQHYHPGLATVLDEAEGGN